MWINPKYRDTYEAKADDCTVPQDNGQRLATIPRTSRGVEEELRVSLDEYQGHKFLSLRIWSADASGDLLHRRGYRLAVGRAPLRETLAAAMLIGAEWDPSTPLIDPMCGSGTIAIEGAMIARRNAPGLSRPFAAEQWPETPDGVWKAARADAKKEIIPATGVPIIAADRDEGAIANAKANAKRVGVQEMIDFRVASVSALEVPDAPRGLLVANPPYGVRVGDSKSLRDLFARLGQVVHERCVGWRVALLSADRSSDAQMRLPFTEVFATSNGGIAVRFVAADVGAG